MVYMNYKALADKVSYYKENEREVGKVCRVFEEIREETSHQRILQGPLFCCAKCFLSYSARPYEIHYYS